MDIENIEVESFTVEHTATALRGTIRGAGIQYKDPVPTYDVGCTYAYDCPITSGEPTTGCLETNNGLATCIAPCGYEYTYYASDCWSQCATQCADTICTF